MMYVVMESVKESSKQQVVGIPDVNRKHGHPCFKFMVFTYSHRLLKICVYRIMIGSFSGWDDYAKTRTT